MAITIATIQSEGYEDHELILQSKSGEDYSWRVKISPDLVLAMGGAPVMLVAAIAIWVWRHIRQLQREARESRP